MKTKIIVILSCFVLGCGTKQQQSVVDNIVEFYALPRNIEFITAANGGVLEYCQEILNNRDYVKKSNYVNSSEYFKFRTFTSRIIEYYYNNKVNTTFFKKVQQEILLKKISQNEFGFSRIVGVYNIDTIMIDRNYQIQINGINYGEDSLISTRIINKINMPLQMRENWTYDISRINLDFNIAPARTK